MISKSPLEFQRSEYLREILRQNYSNFLNSDWKSRILIVGRKILWVSVLFISFSMFSLLYLLRPFLSFKIGILFSNRIGHLIANTEIFFRSQYRKNHGLSKRYILLSGTPANRQVLKMIKRKAPVLENNLFFDSFSFLKRLFPNSFIWINLDSTGYHLYNDWLIKMWYYIGHYNILQNPGSLLEI